MKCEIYSPGTIVKIKKEWENEQLGVWKSCDVDNDELIADFGKNDIAVVVTHVIITRTMFVYLVVFKSNIGYVFSNFIEKIT